METAFLIKGCLRRENFLSIPHRQHSYVLSISGKLLLLTNYDEHSTSPSSLIRQNDIYSSETGAELTTELVLTPRTKFSRCRKFKRSARRFSIEVPGKATLYFRAPNSYETDAWDNAIHIVINILRAKNNRSGSPASTLEPIKICNDTTRSGWYRLPHNKMGYFEKHDNGQWFILNVKDIGDSFQLEMPPGVNNGEFSVALVAIDAAMIAIYAARSIPVFGTIFDFCTEAIILFETYVDQEKNCKKLIRTCEQMKKTLRLLESLFKENPMLTNQIDMDSIFECKKLMGEILERAHVHMSAGKISRFLCASSTEKLLDEALKYLKLSMSSLSLSMEVVLLGDTRQMAKTIDEFRDIVSRLVQESDMIHDSSKGNIIRRLDRFQSIKRVAQFDSPPVEVGENFKVYHMMYNGKMSTAKVYKLDELSEEDPRKIYLMFMKEVFILSQLKHDRIILFHGHSGTATENSLFFEHMEMGSLRSLLDKETVWRTLSAKKRHRIICDIADGMLWLHKENIVHRNLSSLSILLSKDFQAKLSGFGLSKTKDSLSTMSHSAFTKNYRWLAPEGFTAKVSFQADLYSFGIVCWEVLTGMLGKEKSLPWVGKSEMEIMKAVVLDKKRPELPDECATNSNVDRASIVKAQMEQCLKDAPCDRTSFYDVFRAL